MTTVPLLSKRTIFETIMYFTPQNVWYGGFYELAIELGTPSYERLFEALQALWRNASLQGCYLESDVEPNEQKQVAH